MAIENCLRKSLSGGYDEFIGMDDVVSPCFICSLFLTIILMMLQFEVRRNCKHSCTYTYPIYNDVFTKYVN